MSAKCVQCKEGDGDSFLYGLCRDCWAKRMHEIDHGSVPNCPHDGDFTPMGCSYYMCNQCGKYIASGDMQFKASVRPLSEEERRRGQAEWKAADDAVHIGSPIERHGLKKDAGDWLCTAERPWSDEKAPRRLVTVWHDAVDGVCKHCGKVFT